MTTVISDNVHNFAVEGTSDELDIPIKKIFGDWEYKNRHNLCSINSLNWARVLIQGPDSKLITHLKNRILLSSKFNFGIQLFID